MIKKVKILFLSGLMVVGAASFAMDKPTDDKEKAFSAKIKDVQRQIDHPGATRPARGKEEVFSAKLQEVQQQIDRLGTAKPGSDVASDIALLAEKVAKLSEMVSIPAELPHDPFALTDNPCHL